MPFLSRITFFITRPILLPVTVGATGLFFGCYDLSYYFVGNCFYIMRQGSNNTEKASLYMNRLLSVSSGLISLGVFYRLAPQKVPLSIDYSSVKNSWKSIKSAYPIRFYLVSLAVSGTVSGIISAIHENSYSKN